MDDCRVPYLLTFYVVYKKLTGKNRELNFTQKQCRHQDMPASIME